MVGEKRPGTVLGFWNELPRPVFALAPMEDVTDTVFRRLVGEWGRPAVMFTEFIHASAVVAGGKDRERQRLAYTQVERPLVAQIWGTEPEDFRAAAAELASRGFDGIDLNMGCPKKKITSKGACSALIRNPGLAAELYHAAVEGAPGLPVSMKTRIGFDRVVTEEWLGHLLSLRPAALTVHGRLAVDESEGPVDWDEVAKGAQLKQELSPGTLYLGNGDVTGLGQGAAMCARYGLDGVMIGRGVFSNPFVFELGTRDFATRPREEKLELMRRHTELYRDTWGEDRNFEILKKFYKIYLAGFEGASTLKDRAMSCRSYDEIFDLLDAMGGTE